MRGQISNPFEASDEAPAPKTNTVSSVGRFALRRTYLPCLLYLGCIREMILCSRALARDGARLFNSHLRPSYFAGGKMFSKRS